MSCLPNIKSYGFYLCGIAFSAEIGCVFQSKCSQSLQKMQQFRLYRLTIKLHKPNQLRHLTESYLVRSNPNAPTSAQGFLCSVRDVHTAVNSTALFFSRFSTTDCYTTRLSRSASLSQSETGADRDFSTLFSRRVLGTPNGFSALVTLLCSPGASRTSSRSPKQTAKTLQTC